MVATAHRREFARRLAAAAAAYHREEARRRVALPPLADARVAEGDVPKAAEDRLDAFARARKVGLTGSALPRAGFVQIVTAAGDRTERVGGKVVLAAGNRGLRAFGCVGIAAKL